MSRLKDQVTSVLAWKSIVDDVKEGRLNLDVHQSKLASHSHDQASEALSRMMRETYKWLLAPLQEAKPGKGIGDLQWDHFQINPATVNRTEEIEKILREHELLITDWAPIHLAKMLQAWFWKDGQPAVSAMEAWQKTCCYLYLPRLKDDNVLRSTIGAGVSSRDFFGISYGKEDCRYQGFHFGEQTTVIFDDALLLVEPSAASQFADLLAEEKAERDAKAKGDAGGHGSGAGADGGDAGGGGSADGRGVAGGGATPQTPATKKTVFFGQVELDPVKAKLQFSDVAEEVLMLFTSKPGVKVKVSLEIQAEAPTGFDESTQRAARENCNQLKFKNHGFED